MNAGTMLPDWNMDMEQGCKPVLFFHASNLLDKVYKK